MKKRYVTFFALIFAAVVTMFGFLRFASMEFLFDYIRDRQIYLEPAIVRLSSYDHDDQNEFAITVHNESANDIDLIGYSCCCATLSTDDLPLSVPSGEKGVIRFRFRMPLPPPAGFRSTVKEFVILTTNWESVLRGQINVNINAASTEPVLTMDPSLSTIDPLFERQQ